MARIGAAALVPVMGIVGSERIALAEAMCALL
jgi:hypothetical protein